MIQIIIVRIVGVILIISGALMVFSQLPGMLKQVPEKLLSLLKRRKK